MNQINLHRIFCFSAIMANAIRFVLVLCHIIKFIETKGKHMLLVNNILIFDISNFRMCNKK